MHHIHVTIFVYIFFYIFIFSKNVNGNLLFSRWFCDFSVLTVTVPLEQHKVWHLYTHTTQFTTTQCFHENMYSYKEYACSWVHTYLCYYSICVQTHTFWNKSMLNASVSLTYEFEIVWFWTWETLRELIQRSPVHECPVWCESWPCSCIRGNTSPFGLKQLWLCTQRDLLLKLSMLFIFDKSKCQALLLQIKARLVPSPAFSALQKSHCGCSRVCCLKNLSLWLLSSETHTHAHTNHLILSRKGCMNY